MSQMTVLWFDIRKSFSLFCCGIFKSFLIPYVHLRTPLAEAIRLSPYAWSNRALHYRLLHLVDVELDMRVQLEILVLRRMDLIFDVVFEVGHLPIGLAHISDATVARHQC